MDKYSVDVEKKSPVAQAAHTTERVKQSLATRMHNSIEGILLAFIIGIEIVLNFIQFTIAKDLTPADFLFIVTECCTTVLVFYLFVAPGKRGRQALQSFQDACKEWSAACKRLKDSKLLTAFRAHCKAASEEEAAAIREARLDHLENLYVTREEFEVLKLKSKKQLRALKRNGEISKAAYKQILICMQPITVKPYQVNLILTGEDEKQNDRGLKGGDHYEAIGAALKPVTSVALALIASVAGIIGRDVSNPVEVIASIALTCLRICVAVYSGYRFGWTVISREEGYIRARTSYIENFEEEQKKAPQ